MSDLIRDFIKVWSPGEHRKELLAALDAERTKHEKEVASLQEIISDLKQKIEAKPSGIVHEQLPFFEDSVEYKNELDEKGIFWRYGDLG